MKHLISRIISHIRPGFYAWCEDCDNYHVRTEIS